MKGPHLIVTSIPAPVPLVKPESFNVYMSNRTLSALHVLTPPSLTTFGGRYCSYSPPQR